MSKKGNSNTQIVGYRYFLDFLMGICRSSVDALVAIRAGDLPIWTGDVGNGEIAINQGEIFGGDTGEGGLVGTVTVMLGDDDQTVSSKIKNTIAAGPSSSNEGNWTFQDGVGTSDEGATSENAEDISDFRGTTTLWWSGQIASNNPYPKLWKVRTRRARNGWGPEGCWYPDTAVISYAPRLSSGSNGAWNASNNTPHLSSGVGTGGATYNVSVAGNTDLDGINSWSIGEMASFNGDTGKWQKITSGETIIKAMNPAHIIYQCLTDRSWGRGMSRAELDNDAWTYAANYLFNESFGLCLRWSKEGDINDFVQTIIDHIGAALYIDRGTGLMVLRLIRNDYDYDKLPVFTYTSGLLSVDTQETGASTILANEVVVKWRDPIRDQDRQTRVHNLASMQTLGYPISMSRDFPGIADPDLAQRVALRELQVGSAGVKRLKLRFDRRAWRIQPGMVMRIQAPDKGISDMVLRVATYDDGTMIDGTITMDCLQDVFGLPSTIYTTPVDNASPPHVPSDTPPIVYEDAEEASYIDMTRGLDPATFASVGDTEGGVIAMAGRPNTSGQYFSLYATPAGGETERRSGIYAPVAVSGRPLSYYDINIFVSNGADLDNLAIGMTGVMDDELVQVTAFTPSTGTIVIARGGGDTVPVHHAAGVPVIFNDVANSGFTQAYETSDVLTVRLQNVSSSARSDLTLAGTHTVTIVGRHFLPYVMGDIRINGTPALADTPWAAMDDVVFTWASRNRVLQSDQFVAHGEGSVTAETDVTWSVEVWDTTTATLIRTHAGLTVTTYTYDAAEKASGAPDPVTLTFVFYAMRDGVRSLNAYRIPVYYVAHGETVGHAAGVGQAVGAGSHFRVSVGHAAGTSTETNAVGVTTSGIAVAVGHAAGIGGVSWALYGNSYGVGDALGVGDELGVKTRAGVASGVGSADAVSEAIGVIRGDAGGGGLGAAAGSSEVGIAVTGSASGTGTANARGLAIGFVPAVGSASGAGTATGVYQLTPLLDGSGSGISTGGNTISAVVTTTRRDDVVVFAVYAELADGNATPPTFTVAGGTGLVWTRRARQSFASRPSRYNTSATLDVWFARSAAILPGVTVTATSNVVFDDAACVWFGVSGLGTLASPFDPNGILPVLGGADDPGHQVPTGRFSTSKGNDFIFEIVATSQNALSATSPGVGAEGQTHIITVLNSGGVRHAGMTALDRHDLARDTHQPFGITNTVPNWIGVIDAFTANVDNAGASIGRGVATAVGVLIEGSDGAAAGVGTASATGIGLAIGVGAATGTGVASGVPELTTIVSGTGAATGTGTATGVVFVAPFSEGMIVGVGVVSP